MSSALVFFSGGMDSWIHLEWAKRRFDRVQALYVNFGHKYAKNELAAAQRLTYWSGTELLVRDFPLGEFEQDDSFLPLRNMFLLEIGALLSNNLVFGMLYHEGPPDKQPWFTRAMSRILRAQFVQKQYQSEDRKIRILTPFSNYTKTEMLRWYLENSYESRRGVLSNLYNTIGCYDPAGSCGRCISCFNRWVALTNNGLSERYDEPPYMWAAKMFLGGKKKRQRLTSPMILLYKWKYVLEVYKAMRLTMGFPCTTAMKLLRQKRLDVVMEAVESYEKWKKDLREDLS